MSDPVQGERRRRRRRHNSKGLDDITPPSSCHFGDFTDFHVSRTNPIKIYEVFDNSWEPKIIICHMTQFKIMVQYQGSRREKILEGTKLGQMECAGALRPRDGLPEHFGI